MIRESSLLKKVRDHLRSRGFLTWKNHGSNYSPVGLPDLMAVRWGRLFPLELKRSNGKTSPLQDRWLQRFDDAGTPGGVVRSIEDLEQIVGVSDETPDQLVSKVYPRKLMMPPASGDSAFIQGSFTSDELRMIAFEMDRRSK